MSLELRLESFSSPSAAPAPAITGAQLLDARRAGFDEGRAAAAEEAGAATAAALQEIAAALAVAAGEGHRRELAWRAEAAVLAQSIVGRIAPASRAASLAERVVLALNRRVDGPSGAGCRIRCAPDLVAGLDAALRRAGIAGVEVSPGAGPVEVSLPGGALRRGEDLAVDDSGALVVASEDGTFAVAAGDVVHVRRAE